MTTATLNRTAINRHYGAAGLVERIEAAARAAGLDPDRLTREDVAALEEFHIGGRAATRELARRAGFGPGSRVLDLGAGLGGPARTLAAEFGCRVVALEITEEFCRAARWLNRRLGLDGAVDVREGDAGEPPFEDAAFDGVVLEHVTMNIADKAGLFEQCHRVLRPGGRLALYEICQGAGDIVFPVPWAAEPSLSHLVTPEALREHAAGAGFRELEWEDITAGSVDRMRQMMQTAEPGVAALTIDLVIGEGAQERGGNVVRNLEEGRIRVVRAVLER